MNEEKMKVVFTPSDEPYLGRELLFHYDQMISCCLEVNADVAPLSHKLDLSSSQKMACQVIPQSISLALSIRELIRQGYVFGAHVLKRSLIERIMILLYLHHFPDKIGLWDDGWNHKTAPSLAKMFELVNNKEESGLNFKGHELTAPLNSLVHGKPDSAVWNSIIVGDGKFVSAPSKILNSPKLCDELCAEILPWLTIIPAMMCAYFPEKNA
ncbi:hypothetical protein J8L98_23260 [Pseudoalteromonas sp. MMG013]|uniref:DUF5677 domain-containing protein n=1 Tax=Pseudoalteromonas sp. MMG013 TaxID=2822687 RepID=UPI001B39267F|nr:DUF5677 domain-containing protein [Pseudoalteromonas sp. MMG013]MBQ4864606.1 hypothetical protein [Pseudoalteromonas sp. MMG013]